MLRNILYLILIFSIASLCLLSMMYLSLLIFIRTRLSILFDLLLLIIGLDGLLPILLLLWDLFLLCMSLMFTANIALMIISFVFMLFLANFILRSRLQRVGTILLFIIMGISIIGLRMLQLSCVCLFQLSVLY